MLAIQQNILDHAKKSAKNALWTSSSRASQKSVEATGDLIGNKIANKITRVSRNSHTQKKSEAVTYEHDRKISKERYISPEERLEIIN